MSPACRFEVMSGARVVRILGALDDACEGDVSVMIRNYAPPKMPLHTAVAGQMPPMDLFGLEIPAQRRAALSL